MPMKIENFKFLSPAILHWAVGDGAEFKLEQNFSFIYERDGVLITRIAPSLYLDPTFQCDGASVPESLQWLIHQVGKHFGAALVHDCMYWFGRRGNVGFMDVTREEADKVFLAALHATPEISSLQSMAMFEAVKVFGNRVWDDGTDWGIDVPDTDPENPQDLDG